MRSLVFLTVLSLVAFGLFGCASFQALSPIGELLFGAPVAGGIVPEGGLLEKLPIPAPFNGLIPILGMGLALLPKKK